MEIGVTKGLAQSLQYDQRIADARWQDQQLKRAQAENQAELKMFEDDMDYMNAANSFDHNIIKSEADKTIREIGEIVRNNPDFRYNPNVRRQINEKKKYLKSNPHVIRGLSSDDAFKQLNADLAEAAKNPNYHNMQAYQNLLQQKQNYLKTGNQYGDPKLGPQAFVYTKPRDFINLSKTGEEIGNKFKDMQVVPLKNGRSGAYQTVPKEQSLTMQAEQLYRDNKEQFDQQYMGQNPIEVAKQLIRSGIESKFDYGNTNLSDQLTVLRAKHAQDLADTKQGQSAYVLTVLNKGQTVTNGEFLGATFGPRPSHFIKNNNGSVKIDNTGDVFNYDGYIADRNYRNDGKYQKDGIKVVTGYVNKPLEWAKENNVIYDPWGPGDSTVSPDWNQKAEVVTDFKDGKPIKYVRIKVDTDVNANDASYQGAFDAQVQTAKQRIDAQSSYIEQPRVYEGTEQQFKQNGWNDEQIKQGVSQGIIKIK